MMQNTMIYVVAACCTGAVSFLAGAGGADIISDFHKNPEPYGLQLVSLDYKDGEFHQIVAPINTDIVQADWSAQILRGDIPLCGDGGRAPYDGEPKRMDPDSWTGDTCPPLKHGDRAIATWTYKNVNGNIVTISGKVKIQ